MNKFTKIASSALVAFAFTCGVQASQAAEKVGYVNSQYVFQQLAKKTNLNSKIQNTFKSRINQVKSLQSRYKSKMDKYKKNYSLMKTDDKIKAQREIASLQSDLKLKGEALKQDIAKEEREQSRKLGSKIKQAVTTVAKSGHYDLVIDASAVLYATSNDDLSKKVLNAIR